MSYMIEISSEKQTELMEHAEKAYKHVGKMLECIEDMQQGKIGQRDGDEWYIRQGASRGYGMRDEIGYRDDIGMRDDMMGERRGYSRTRYGNRESYPYYKY